MVRKSLGGRAACLLMENDDMQERIERRKSLALLGTPDKRVKPGKPDTGKKKNSNFNYDFSSVISLCTANKVNLKNTWSLDLIDHIDDILASQKDSFQKASCTLQASVQIYEKRVDSTHQDMFKMLENVNRTRIGIANDAEESREARKKVPKSSSNSGAAQSFLESNLSSITYEKVEREYEVDPLFRKMSKNFDAGGAKGLLLNHLKVHHGPVVVFDTSDAVAFPVEEKEQIVENPQDDEEMIEQQPQNDVVEKRSSKMAFKSPVGRINKAPICPSLEVLHRTLQTTASKLDELDEEQLEQEMYANPAVSPSNEENPASANMFNFSEENNYYDDDDGFIYDGGDMYSDDGGEDQNSNDLTDADGDGQSEQQQHQQDGGKKKTNSFNDFLGQEIDFSQFNEYSFFKATSKSSNWAGPSHWKFGLKTLKPKASKTGTDNKRNEDGGEEKDDEDDDYVNKRSSSKKAVFLDFNEEPQEIEDFPTRISQINLSKTSKQGKKVTDLPDDLHYSVQDLCKLFLKPVVISEVLKFRYKRKSTGSDSRRQSDNSFYAGGHDAGYFDDVDDDMHDSMGGGLSIHIDGDVDNMVAPSHVVEKIRIDYARKAKKVDVKKLKETIWEEIEPHHQAFLEQEEESVVIQEDGEDEDTKTTTFCESVRKLVPVVDDENVTIPFYFICLLHLANENNLEFEGLEDLSDFIIR